MEILELKITVTKIKHMLDRLDSWKEKTEERVSELEDCWVEFNLYNKEENKIKNKQKQNNGASETCGTITRGLAFMLFKSQNRKSEMLKIFFF